MNVHQIRDQFFHVALPTCLEAFVGDLFLTASQPHDESTLLPHDAYTHSQHLAPRPARAKHTLTFCLCKQQRTYEAAPDNVQPKDRAWSVVRLCVCVSVCVKEGRGRERERGAVAPLPDTPFRKPLRQNDYQHTALCIFTILVNLIPILIPFSIVTLIDCFTVSLRLGCGFPANLCGAFCRVSHRPAA